MNFNGFQDAGSDELRSLLQVAAPDKAERVPWEASDLAAVVRHQLACPLQAELDTVVLSREDSRSTLGDAPSRIGTFEQLLEHPKPPVELVRCMKDYARLCRDDGSLPADAATLLYFAAIALAHVRCGQWITELDRPAVREGLAWGLSRTWSHPSLSAVLREGWERV